MQESGIDLGFDALNDNEKFQPSTGFYATLSIPLDDVIRYLYDFLCWGKHGMCVLASKYRFTVCCVLISIQHQTYF